MGATIGIARDDRERFQFTIERYVLGGFLLSIRYSGDGEPNLTGAGVWPTIERAKEIAQQSASRLLNGATVEWSDQG